MIKPDTNHELQCRIVEQYKKCMKLGVGAPKHTTAAQAMQIAAEFMQAQTDFMALVEMIGTIKE